MDSNSVDLFAFVHLLACPFIILYKQDLRIENVILPIQTAFVFHCCVALFDL